jgi:hypothetical protein
MSHTYRDPNELTIHAALKNQPRLKTDHPKMLAMRKSMKATGPDSRAILITAEGEIVDGRHWWWNAKALQWPKVRVELVPPERVREVILSTLANRRHYTPGQLTYIVAGMLPEIFEDGHLRQVAGLQNHAKSPMFPVANSVRNESPTKQSVSTDLGVSVRSLEQAAELHRFFEDKKKRTMTDRDDVTEKGVTFKEFFEPRILLEEDPEAPRTRPYGLGAALAGIKQVLDQERKGGLGIKHSGGKAKEVSAQMELFKGALHDLQVRYSYWNKWPEEVREQAVEELPVVVEKMPDDLLEKFERAIKAERSRRNKS